MSLASGDFTQAITRSDDNSSDGTMDHSTASSSESPYECGNSSDEHEEPVNDESDEVHSVHIFPDREDKELIAFNRSKMCLRQALMRNDIKLHAHTEKSVNDAILEIMKLHLKDRGSKASLHRILCTISSLLPEEHNLPSTSHNILKYVKSLAPPIPESNHYYCEDCLFYHGMKINGRCVVCAENGDENMGTKLGHFLSYGIGATLKYYYECRNLASAIDSQSRTVAADTYSDIQDGSVYKILNANRDQYDINLIMNTDGIRIRDSIKKELWIVMFSIVEVPMNLRESFIIFAAIWYDKPKPKMKSFLKPNCEELVKLHSEGFNWKHPATGNVYNSKVYVPGGVLDAPARAMAQNVLQFNGDRGCNTCEIQTVKSARIPNKKAVRIYPYKADLVLRTKESMENQAREALERNIKHVMGVKGPSLVSIVPFVDISMFFIPEYLHSVLLGVMRQLLMIWLSLPGPWNIKHLIAAIDDCLAGVKHPDFVHRAPRELAKMKFMKASDFYYFLLFEGLSVLQNRLPERFFHHFMLLVKGIYLLLQSNVKESDIVEADRHLQLFVQQFQGLYGDRQLTSNIHHLCHLALVVRRYGPLSCINAFLFEHLNGLIARATHGTQNVTTEIANNVRIPQGVQVLKNIVNSDFSVECWGLSYDNESAKLLGKNCNIDVSPQEAEVLGESALIFSRAKIGRDVFTSEIYKKLSSENFHVMFQQGNATKYAVIKYFAKTQSNLYVCLRLYKINHLEVFYNPQTRSSINHLIPVESDDVVLV